jgi:glutaconate CoA-transferase subunit B
MRVRSVHPGVEERDVRSRTAFDLGGADEPWPVTPAPTQDELAVLREVVDPTGVLADTPRAAPADRRPTQELRT